jgi:threonine aldolase
VIDLRSDTVTLPSAPMRAAIAAAPVGDDQYGEDPTVNLLQERIADLLGKEAALWLPSGTMANQVALLALTRPGDDVIVSRESHAEWHETGASAANAGVQFTPIGTRGVFAVDEFRAAIKPRGHVVYPPTTLVEIENTQNRAGGIVFPQLEAERICAAATERDIATFLDGARLWNAAVASADRRRSLPHHSSCCPWRCRKGSALRVDPCSQERARRSIAVCDCGGDLVARCGRRGLFAAAGLYALDHNIDRLADDHANARVIADRLSTSRRVDLDPATVQTNILVFGLTADASDAPTVVGRAKERGVLIFAFGPRTIRAVTHLDVSRDQCAQAADVLLEIIGGN